MERSLQKELGMTKLILDPSPELITGVVMAILTLSCASRDESRGGAVRFGRAAHLVPAENVASESIEGAPIRLVLHAKAAD